MIFYTQFFVSKAPIDPKGPNDPQDPISRFPFIPNPTTPFPNWQDGTDKCTFCRTAVIVGAAFGRMRRQVHSCVVNTDSTPDIHIITPLDVFFVNIAVASLTFPSLLCQQAVVKISTRKLYMLRAVRFKTGVVTNLNYFILIILEPKHSRSLCRIVKAHGSSVWRSPFARMPLVCH